MLIIILTMLAGIAAGWMLRLKQTDWIGQWVLILIWALLFLLGLQVGGNEQIITNLNSLGLEALLIATLATLGSVLGAWWLWRKITRTSKVAIVEPDGQGSQTDNALQDMSDEPSTGALKGSLVILAFFVLGVVCGYFHWLPAGMADSDVSFYALLALLFSVGFSIGADPLMVKRFRTLNPRIVLLPFFSIIGTFIGSFLAAWMLSGRPIADVMAVGSGFGYYSLSSILINQYKGAELGTVALLANIFREMFTLLGAPLMKRWMGPLAPIAAGGATSMDTTLPIIVRTCGKQYTVVSIYCSFVTDFSVPFLVTFFCSL